MYTSLSSSSSSNLDRRAIVGGEESDELSSSESSSGLVKILRVSIAGCKNDAIVVKYVTGIRWGSRTTSPVCWRHVYNSRWGEYERKNRSALSPYTVYDDRIGLNQ